MFFNLQVSFLFVVTFSAQCALACFGSGGAGGGTGGGSGGGSAAPETTPSPAQYQSQNALPPAARKPTTTAPSKVDNYPNLPKNGYKCGHSRYWNASDKPPSIDGAGIVGGTPALINEYPYQVRIAWKRSPSLVCGGSIINEQFVLSAAHCCQAIGQASDVNIIVGDHNRSRIDTGEQTVAVVEVTPHPDYDMVTQEYDFCLMRLAQNLTWNRQVQPVCLPTSCDDECQYVNQDGNEDTVIISGWGALTYEDGQRGSSASILQKARVPIASRTRCAQTYKKVGATINDLMICAGYDAGGIDSCQGDSGGPMVCYKYGYYQLDGVTSFGQECAKADYYGVYARVCQVLDWISDTLATPLKTTTKAATTTTSKPITTTTTVTNAPTTEVTTEAPAEVTTAGEGVPIDDSLQPRNMGRLLGRIATTTTTTTRSRVSRRRTTTLDYY